MRPVLALAALLLVVPATLPASEFDWMTREFARQSGTPQLHIPFFGLARFAIAVVHPAGASDLKLAVFEHTTVRSEDFARVVNSTVGSAWKPIIRVHDQSGEMSNIYAQPDGKYLRVLIATLDGSEAVFVEVRIRPEELIKFVDTTRREKSHRG